MRWIPIQSDNFIFYLGDNILIGGLKSFINDFKRMKSNCHLVLSQVSNPNQFGVAEVINDRIVSIKEKPISPKSNLAVTGIYLYDSNIFEAVNSIKPSKRGELEITDVNKEYLNQNRLTAKILNSAFWLDTGTHDALVEASNFIKTVENREGKKVSCLEEIAYKYNYIDTKKLKEIINNYDNEYGDYLKKLL